MARGGSRRRWPCRRPGTARIAATTSLTCLCARPPRRAQRRCVHARRGDVELRLAARQPALVPPRRLPRRPPCSRRGRQLPTARGPGSSSRLWLAGTSRDGGARPRAAERAATVRTARSAADGRRASARAARCSALRPAHARHRRRPRARAGEADTSRARTCSAACCSAGSPARRSASSAGSSALGDRDPGAAVARPAALDASREAFVTAALLVLRRPAGGRAARSRTACTGDYAALATKALLDGFAAIALAATLGWGVGCAAITRPLVPGRDLARRRPRSTTCSPARGARGAHHRRRRADHRDLARSCSTLTDVKVGELPAGARRSPRRSSGSSRC